MTEIPQIIPIEEIREKQKRQVQPNSFFENTFRNTELLSEPHHPFLEAMAAYFEPDEFRRFIEITKERNDGSLNPDTPNPFKEGADLLYDEEVLDEVDNLYSYLTERDRLMKTDTAKQVMKAAMFSIWAYGTNPDVKHRVRHEGKPYAIHPARAAMSFKEFDDKTLQSIFLHDVTEDTKYKEEDIAALFSEDVATTVRQVTKIKSNNLEEFLSTEVSVIYKYLQLHDNHPFAQRLLEQKLWMKFDHSDQPIGTIKELSKDFLVILRLLIDETQDSEMLTLMRLCSKIDTEDGVRAFIVKLADVEDNMETINALATKKTKEKAKTKARLAYNFFAPLGYALGVNDKATQIEEKAFHVLYEAEGLKYQQSLTDSADKNSELIQALEQRFEVELKQSFIQWLQKYYPAYAEQGSKITHDINMFTKADRRRYGMTRPYKPAVVVNCPDDVISAKYEEFLCDTRVRNRHKITIRKVTPKVNKLTDNRIDLRTPYGTVHRQNLTIFTREHNGEIADLFRPDATKSQVEHGKIKLRNLQQTFRSGKFNEFMTRLERGTKRIELTRDSSGVSRELYVPSNATFQDLLLLSGLDRAAVINPTRFDLTDIVPEGISVLFGSNSLSRSEQVPDPDTYDLLNTTEAARIHGLHIQYHLEDISGNTNRESLFRERAVRRGRRIAETMIDSYVLHRLFPSDPTQVSVGYLPSNFWRGLFEKEAFFKGDEDYFYQLGLTPLSLPDRHNLKPKDVLKWVSQVPDLEAFILESYNWIDRNCYVLYPEYNTGRRDLDEVEVAKYILQLHRPITVIDYDTEQSDVQLTYATPNQLSRSRNLTEFHPSVKILSLPVEHGQIDTSAGGYNFFVSIDTHVLEQVLDHIFPLGDGDVTDLIRHLYGRTSDRVFSAVHRKENHRE